MCSHKYTGTCTMQDTHIHVHTYTHVDASAHTHTHTRMHARTHARTHTHTHTHTHTDARTHAHTHTHTHTRTQTYTHGHKHTFSMRNFTHSSWSSYMAANNGVIPCLSGSCIMTWYCSHINTFILHHVIKKPYHTAIISLETLYIKEILSTHLQINKTRPKQ